MNQIDIVNEDGTVYDPPIIPEYAELKETYPTCELIGHGCTFCDKCLLGDYFKPTEEEDMIIRTQQAVVRLYDLKHGNIG